MTLLAPGILLNLVEDRTQAPPHVEQSKRWRVAVRRIAVLAGPTLAIVSHLAPTVAARHASLLDRAASSHRIHICSALPPFWCLYRVFVSQASRLPHVA